MTKRRTDLKDILLLLRRRICCIILWGAIGGTVMGCAAAFVIPPEYRSEASLYVYSSSEGGRSEGQMENVDSSDINILHQLADTCGVIAGSREVLGKVINDLQLDSTVEEMKENIEIYTVNETGVACISVSASDPDQAEKTANKIIEILPDEFKRVVKTGEITVIDKAKAPDEPVSPDLFLCILAGILAGIFGSWGIFFLKGYFDPRIKTEDDLETVLNDGTPVLGIVPSFRKAGIRSDIKKNGGKNRRFDGNERKNMLTDHSEVKIKEAYNRIRTKLLLTALGDACPVYAVTSSKSGEGKSISVLNLAVSFAMVGKKVLLIDADMRGPVLQKYLHAAQEEGLSGVLADIKRNLTINRTGQKNLFFLSAGEVPDDPEGLLESGAFEAAIGRLKKEFDYIFIDTPSLGIAADAAIIGRYVDGYILVARAGKVQFADVQDSVDMIRAVNGRLAGAVLNDYKDNRKMRDYKYYGKF